MVVINSKEEGQNQCPETLRASVLRRKAVLYLHKMLEGQEPKKGIVPEARTLRQQVQVADTMSGHDRHPLCFTAFPCVALGVLELTL